MICWVDTETTGLIPEKGHLLEVALVVTDDDLHEIAHTSIVLRPVMAGDLTQSDMDPVVWTMHTENGLLDAVKKSGARRHEAEAQLIEFVNAFRKNPSTLSKIPFAGSTVGFDRAWLRVHMPTFESMLSYRSIYVSSITELAKRWAPAVYEGRPKAGQKAAHRALADVYESIEYLRYYRRVGFIAPAVVDEDEPSDVAMDVMGSPGE